MSLCGSRASHLGTDRWPRQVLKSTYRGHRRETGLPRQWYDWRGDKLPLTTITVGRDRAVVFAPVLVLILVLVLVLGKSD